jgi:hypothetical protein
MHTSIHSEVAKIIRHPHAMVLTAYTHSPRRSGFLASVAPKKLASQELDASVEASGPRDFAVRVRAARQEHPRVHRIPPRVRDDREPPLLWDETVADKPVIWVRCKEEIFFAMGLDSSDNTKSSPSGADIVVAMSSIDLKQCKISPSDPIGDTAPVRWTHPHICDPAPGAGFRIDIRKTT